MHSEIMNLHAKIKQLEGQIADQAPKRQDACDPKPKTMLT